MLSGLKGGRKREKGCSEWVGKRDKMGREGMLFRREVGRVGMLGRRNRMEGEGMTG